MRTILLFVVALALGACSGPEDPVQAEVSASKFELGQMNRDFAAALNARDATAAAGFLPTEPGTRRPSKARNLDVGYPPQAGVRQKVCRPAGHINSVAISRSCSDY